MSTGTSMNLVPRVTLGALLLFATVVLSVSVLLRGAAVAQDGPPPEKGYVCELFDCPGGGQSCMTIFYLLETEDADYVITYDCYEG